MWLGTLLLIMALATTAFADPRMWEPTGRMIRGEGPVRFQASAMNADGLTMLVWTDEEFGNRDIWAQLLDSQGVPLWEQQGRRIMQTPEYEDSLRVIAWQDGFMLAFARKVYPYSAADLFFCPVDLRGAAIWPQNGGTGVEVSHRSIEEGRFKQLVALGNGNVGYSYVEAARGSFETVWTQFTNQIDALGNVQWASPLEFEIWYNGISPFGITGDNLGGMYVSASREVNGDWEQYLAKFNSGGALEWEFMLPDGLYHLFYSEPLFVTGEGCYLPLNDTNVEPTRMVLQLISPEGTEIWPTPVVLSSDREGLQFNGIAANVEELDTTGVIMMWIDHAGSSNDSDFVFTQKVSSAGELEWGAEGLDVCGLHESVVVTARSVASDFLGGLIGSFITYESDGFESLYSRMLYRITSDGLSAWGDSCGIQVLGQGESVSTSAFSVGPFDQIGFAWSQHLHSNYVRTILLDKISGETLPPENGITLAEGLEGGVDDVRALGLDNGNSVVFWMDTRHDVSDNLLYYQMMSPNGAVLPEIHGRPLFRWASEVDDEYDFCSDGHGGFYVISKPVKEDQQARTIGTRIRADGTQVGDTAGVELAVQSMHLAHTNVACAPDGSGGVYFVWQVQQDSPFHTYVQKFDSTLTPIWLTPLSIPTLDYHAVIQQVRESSSGSCIVLSSQGHYVFMTKFLSNGVLAWTTQICETLGGTDRADFSVDSNENCIVAWVDRRDNAQRDVLYAQTVYADGTERFWHGGTPVADSVATFDKVLLVQTTTGEPVAVFASRPTGEDWGSYAMKLNLDLQSVWGGRGYRVGSFSGWIEEVSAVADDLGGIILSFLDYSSEASLRAIHLTAEGTITDEYWSGGGAISDEPGLTASHAVAFGGETDRFYCFWDDWFDNEQVLGQYIDETFSSVKPPASQIISQIALSQNYPNPFNANTEIVFSLPREMDAKLQIYDVTGRLVTTLADEQFMAGEHRISFDARDVASGVYFYELRAGDVKVARKMLLLK